MGFVQHCQREPRRVLLSPEHGGVFGKPQRQGGVKEVSCFLAVNENRNFLMTLVNNNLSVVFADFYSNTKLIVMFKFRNQFQQKKYFEVRKSSKLAIFSYNVKLSRVFMSKVTMIISIGIF